MERFISPAPVVKLEKAFSNPFNNLIATARTCYSGKGIVAEDSITEDRRRLAKSIYNAGHHTTLQHAHFQFSLSNVSRQFVWSFLHSHPFYNSEQVSQRYVAVKPGSFLVPSLKGRALSLYEKTLSFQMEAYSRLSKELLPIARNEYLKLFKVHKARSGKKKGKGYTSPQLDLPFFKSADDLDKAVIKKAQEAARYVIPVSAFTYLYHTISAVTLLRYYRLCRMYDTPLEQQIVVEKMVHEVLRVEPLYKVILEEPLEADAIPEYQFFHSEKHDRTSKLTKRFLGEFDASLEGRISRLIDYRQFNEPVLARSVREVLGIPSSTSKDKKNFSDRKAIRLVLDPSINKLYGETLNLSTMSKLARTLSHVSYTFRKRISHTADSQDQRHRTTPASRPCLHRHIMNEPDYITPAIISQDARIEKYYDETMERIWDSINRLRKLGVSNELVMYLLPNAVAVRFTESGDLLNLRHKYAMRLCYNAQEEIWRASLDEVEQIGKVNPVIGKYLLPPCTSRDMAGVRPVCPEGGRFCGVKVWRLDLKDYKRII